MGNKILLADDSVTVQKIVTLTFSDEGVDVVPVNSGTEAISRLHYMHPALVMADVSLPGKNGYEICEFVKSHPELKNTPVILLVPAFEPFDEARAARVGADHHLTKPFQSIRTLIATVKNLIDPPDKPPVQPIVWPSTQPPATARANGAHTDAELIAAVPDAGHLPQASGEQAAVPSPAATTFPTAAEPVAETPQPDHGSAGFFAAASPAPAAPALDAATVENLLELDDVLELEDVLPSLPLVFAPPKFAVPVVSSAGTITQAVKLTAVEAITTTSIPQSVIDDIAARVTSQVSLQLSAQFSQFATQMFEHLTTRLAQDIAPRVASEVLARLNQAALPTPVAVRTEITDAVLDI